MKKIILLIFLFVFSIPFSIMGNIAVNINHVYPLHDEEKLKQIALVYESSAKNSKDAFTLKVLGVIYHNLSVLKVGGAPNKAIFFLEKAYEINPTDHETLAFLGSATTMAARDSWNFFTKLSDVNKGINLIDKAVSKAPQNCIIRVIRANHSLNIPEFLGRKKLAKQDFLKIEQWLVQDPSILDLGTIADVYYQLGLIYKGEKEFEKSKFYFMKALKTSPESLAAKASKKEF